jgi:hypothetical protein
MESGRLTSFQAWMERKCGLMPYSSIATNRSGLEPNIMGSIEFTMEQLIITHHSPFPNSQYPKEQMHLRFMPRWCFRCVLLRAKETLRLAKLDRSSHGRPQMAHPGLSQSRSRNQQRKYHNRTIQGPMREPQAYLTRKLRERDLRGDLEGEAVRG